MFRVLEGADTGLGGAGKGERLRCGLVLERLCSTF